AVRIYLQAWRLSMQLRLLQPIITVHCRSIAMTRLKPLPMLLAGVFFIAGAAYAETCLSPYIKGLKEPEKVMYLWTLPVGQGSDYLSVIDVSLASPTYGKILKKIE